MSSRGASPSRPWPAGSEREELSDAHPDPERNDRHRGRLVPGRCPGRRRGDRADRRGPCGRWCDRRGDDRRHREVRHPGRHRRPHPHGAAVRRHVRQGHLRDGHASGGLRRHHLHRRLCRPDQGPAAPRGPRRLAQEGRGQRRHRLRLPHDHVGRQRRDPGRDGPAGRRGRPRLQAVHRLSGRLPLAGRPHLPGDAADEEERRHDPDARRERPRHRHPGRRPGRRGRHRSHRPRPRPRLASRGRGDQPDDPARRDRGRPGLLRPHVGEGGARRPDGRAQPRRDGVGGDLPAVPLPHARRPRQRLRRRQVRVLAAAAHQGPRGGALERTQA